MSTQDLNSVGVGDIIFGLGAGGQEKLLLVYKADKAGFSARHVTSQVMFRFDRTGKTRVYADGGYVVIVSIARLPQDMYEVALGLDRKFAAKPEYPDSIVTAAEIQLILTHDKFFKAHLLPGTESIVNEANKRNAVRSFLQLEYDPIHSRENPPMWDEYLGDLPALVELLDRPASVDEVSDFLAGIASRRKRPTAVIERSRGAAESLLRLRQNWT